MHILESKIKKFPVCPGVYIMYGEDGEVLYVGKAVNLRSRIRSYFQNRQALTPRVYRLILKVKDVQYKVTHNEDEALLLEERLIKRYQPRYNVSLKDDKTYPYLEITEEEYPRLVISRRPKSRNIFGPYTNVGLLKMARQSLQREFPLRLCKKMPKRECLNYHIGLCKAPCTGKISYRDYQKIVQALLRLLEKKKQGIFTPFEQKVYSVVSHIPLGQVRTYGWVAERIGMPRSARAVGQALKRNPFPLIIPCHRVIRQDGSIGGYSQGIEVKRRLLREEGNRDI